MESKLVENKIRSETIIKSPIDFERFKEEALQTKFIKGNIYLFANIGLVSSGKSTLSKYLEAEIKAKLGENNIRFVTISSDKIRMEIENSMRSEKEKLGEDKFSEKVSKKQRDEFDKEFEKELEKWEEDKFNIILLDKNFFVNTLTDLKK